jgi:cysteinyl-tRNA synthetase
MKKTYNLTDVDIKIISKAKNYFNEKTEVEAIKKVLKDFERVNHL